MRYLFLSLLPLLIFAAGLAAQAQNDTQADVRVIENRYITASNDWRLSLITYVFKGDQAKYQEVEAAMREFTSATTSYVVYKRPGEKLALKLYYINLENIARLDHLRQMIEDSQREYPEYTKDFFAKYEIEDKEFENFEKFEPVYERVMNRWRGEFEDALKKKDVAALTVLREDMKIFQQGVLVFVLLPGKSGRKVPQLQVMENDLRHGIVMIRMYEQTTQDELDTEKTPVELGR
jgi:hypothetical protein